MKQCVGNTIWGENGIIIIFVYGDSGIFIINNNNGITMSKNTWKNRYSMFSKLIF